MRKINAVIAGLLSLVSSSALASFGTSGWTVLKKVQSSQCMAITATVPSQGNLSSVFYNPAVSGSKEKEVLFISETGVDGESLGGVLFSLPINSKNSAYRGNLTAGLAYYDAGPIDLNWLEGNTIKTRTVSVQRDMLGIISYKHNLATNLSGAVSLKIAESVLAEEYKAQAYASDLGVLYNPIKHLAVSAAMQNLGTSTKFLKKESPLPTAAFLGAGYTIGTNKSYIMPAAGVTYYTNDKESVTEAGIEVGYESISFNMGHRFTEGDLNSHYGVRMRMGSMIVGYAFNPADYLDPVHHLTVGFRFSNNSQKKETIKSKSLENIVNY